ncbi:peptidylprolyl isomerase [Hymenobacter psychrotolerans]|uniref:Peptidyl-prolyl cis-trans isomerase n=1 Tax=Hymenobacter psychrotolerans DSM 18569 TaxID=1121959 RepID=A0A1M6RXE1_9BACT|nr:peptidylprolyl isomerase [Hymenobacter psychrotolerans]SHK36969.1 peptidyl-prolyl cis-trans isomerase B (cyclophilin B) [Hymenobacter psychrotolerans DSM 18569]
MPFVSRVAALLTAFLFLLTSVAAAAKAPKPSKKDQLVTISTSLGEIKLVLFDVTPLHKANFLKLAESRFYTGTTFHRVIPNFMVQGGDANSKDTDPSNDGMGQPNEQTIPAEIRPELKHKFGAVAAARQGDFVNPQRASSASQFYLVQNHQGVPHLDGQYTVFGQVVSGLDVIDKIATQPKDDRDRPLTDLKMTVKVEKLKKKKISELYGYAY